MGSHSGRFVSLSLDGNKEWETQFDDRIEATACCQDGIIAVGLFLFFNSFSFTLLSLFMSSWDSLPYCTTLGPYDL